MSRAEMKQKALENLKGKWGIAIIAMVLMGLIVEGPSLLGLRYAQTAPLFNTLLSLVSLALIPISIGYNRIYMDLAEGDTPDVDRLFVGFKDGRYPNNILTMVLMGIFTLLWFFVFIIPGFIKAFAYSMTPYILADPDFEHLSPTEVITKSREMMDGHKMEYFILSLSFILWFLLVGITFGIALFYVGPYVSATTAEFYYKVKGGKPLNTSFDGQPKEDTSKSEDPFFY